MPLPAGLLRKPPGSFVPDFYVSPSGLATNSGSIVSPWSLAYALAGAGGVITPGKKIALRGGTYGTSTTIWEWTVSGTAGNLIEWRNFPGERAIIDGCIRVGQSPDNTNGHYNRLQGEKLNFVCYNSAPATAGTSNTARGSGLEFINLIIHDAANSGLYWSGTGGTGYGLIMYHNGKDDLPAPEHGFYVGNYAGATKYLNNCCSFQNWSHDFQLSGPATGRIESSDCINFGTSEIQSGAVQPFGREYFVGLQEVVLTRHYSYGIGGGKKGEAAWFISTSGQVFTLQDSLLYGGMDFNEPGTGVTWSSKTVARNKFYALQEFLWYAAGPSLVTPPDSWDHNQYGSKSGTQQIRITGEANRNFTTLATWKSQMVAVSGFTPDASGDASYFASASGEPASGSQIITIPNTYETGRGHIAIYNWDDAANVSVDISSIVAIGQSYEIRNMQALWTTASSHIPSTPVASGVYAGGTVSLPMTATPLDGIAGRANQMSPRAMGPRFGAFLVTLA